LLFFYISTEEKNAEKVFFIILTHGKQGKTITKARSIEWC